MNLKGLEKVVADNSPAILSGIAVAGTIATAVLAGKAAVSSTTAELVDEIHGVADPSRNMREYVERHWKLYVPAVGTGVLTITCIVMSNRIGTRRAAAMATAYAISEKAWVQYKDKVVEHIGEKEERKIRDAVAQDQVTNNPLVGNQVVVTAGREEQLCYESFTGRYFMSSMEDMKKAQNDLNYDLLNHLYASLSDFYDKLGMPHTDISDEIGWRSDALLELQFSSVLDDRGRACISMNYKTVPVRDYYHCRS